jgi:hypothetical protein
MILFDLVCLAIAAVGFQRIWYAGTIHGEDGKRPEEVANLVIGGCMVVLGLVMIVAAGVLK